MLHLWDAVEADFRRDYGITLVEQIDTISWRLFTVLFKNLSPYGATAFRADELRKNNETGNSEDSGDEAGAADFFSRALSTSKGAEKEWL